MHTYNVYIKCVCVCIQIKSSQVRLQEAALWHIHLMDTKSSI